MRIGDLVTYKQHKDNQVYPCPWGRMGLIIGIDPGDDDEEKGFEVYWHNTEKKVWHVEGYLELAR
jgi:hypothetical protein